VCGGQVRGSLELSFRHSGIERCGGCGILTVCRGVFSRSCKGVVGN